MKEKKRVAFFGIKYFPSRGGTSRVAENLILNLLPDYDVTIYCYRNKVAKTHIPGVRVIEFPEIKLGSFGVFLYYALCYFHITLKGDYHIIHAHKIDSFFYLKGLSKQAKVIATVHGVPYNDGKWGWLAKRFFKINERRFLNFPGIKTAISEPLCNHYKNHCKAEVKFIANGISLPGTGAEGRVEPFWPAKVPRDRPFVLFAARRIIGIKGVHTMLRAYKAINYTGYIFIAGELENNSAYLRQIKELSKELHVHFLGFVHPLPVLLELVRKCEYFVFPSETEGMSIMLLEVASTGKPILASNIPENRQVFDDGEVLYFRNKDIGDLSEKVLWAERNRETFITMGLKAKTKVSAHYTWDKIVREYIALYEQD